MTERLRGDPAICAVSELPPGRYPELDATGLQERALLQFITTHPDAIDLVDGFLVTPSGMASGGEVDIFVHERWHDALGIRPRFGEVMNTGGSSYAVMVARAAMAIHAGKADAVLCLGAGKFPEVSGGGGRDMAKLVCDIEFEYPYGAYIPPLYALVAARFMHDRNVPREALAAAAVAQRSWAMQHPEAVMRSKGEMTIEDVLGSRPVAEPFHLLDCSVPCEGGGAILVARGEIAAEFGQPAHILGFGEHHDHGSIVHASDLAAPGISVAARSAFDMSGVTPSDVSVAELYDAFSFNPLLLMEETGIAPPGGSAELALDGATAPGGHMPVNTYGGLLSFGHTGDASGVSMIVEAARQVMSIAGDRQVEADIALVHTYGGIMADHCTLILGRST
jgi:acetyl-CoA acetyltransferase